MQIIPSNSSNSANTTNHLNSSNSSNEHEKMQHFYSPKFRFRLPRGWWKKVLLIIMAVFILMNVFLTLWLFRLDISELAEPIPQTTFIYDKNGKLASEFSSSKSEPIPLAQVPAQLRNAVIATEDRRFYEHKGVDIRSIARALYRDIRSRELTEGGSTITQQLAKNMILTNDKTLSRKLKEAGLALKIELTYTKDEILELYLNVIYFGEGQWGVQRAAKTYFAKNTDQLTLAESATLAGLPKAPSKYSPFNNKEGALERRNIVLALMNEQKLISDAEFQKAKGTPMTLAKETDVNTKTTRNYPDFMDAVLTEATELYGFTESQLLTSGLKIYTTVDPDVQLAAEAVYADNQFFPESKPDQLIQSGVVIIDHHNGEIRGVVGHRGEGVYRGFNNAMKLKRQPGSAFKPLAVYGPALEKGYTPESMLFDGNLNINGYQPKDWDLQTRGQVTLKEAVAKSWNIPAVWLLNEIGIDAGLNFAAKTGIPLTKDDRKLGIALGGLSEGTSPLRMAQAFSAFANQGNMHTAHTISKIVTDTGKVVVEVKLQPVLVMKPEVAYTMTTLLVNAVTAGTATAAALDRPVAGKTGTTELPDTAEFAGITGQVAKDAWFVGYTPELTAAVWMGYDKTDKNHYLVSGSAPPAVVFKEIMSRALKGKPVVPFPIPASIVNATTVPKKEEPKKLEKKNDDKKGNDDRGRVDRDDDRDDDERDRGNGSRNGKGNGKKDD